MIESKMLTYIKLYLVTLSWGGSFIAVSLIVDSLTPGGGVALRYLASTLFIFPYILYTRGKACLKIRKSDIPVLIIISLAGPVGYNLAFFTALKYTSTINASLIAALNPTLTALLSLVILKEKSGPKEIAGIALSFLGVFFVVTRGSIKTILDMSFNIGDLIMLLGPFCWAIYSIYGKKAMKSIEPITAVAYSCLFGGILLVIIFYNNLTLLPAETLIETTIPIVYLSVFATVIAYVWWYKGIESIGPNKTSVFINFVPINTMILSVIILNEKILPFHIIGVILVCSGVYLTNKPDKVPKENQLTKEKN